MKSLAFGFNGAHLDVIKLRDQELVDNQGNSLA